MRRLDYNSCLEDTPPLGAGSFITQAFDYVLMMGEYIGRSVITLERYAHNLMDSSRYQLQDNNGVSYDNQAIIKNGPCAYETTLPIKAMVEAMRQKGIPADISDTAATFVCNNLYYGVLHDMKQTAVNTKAGWAHLPTLPATATTLKHLGQPSMSLDILIAGIRTAITTLKNHDVDIKKSIASGLQI